MLKIDQKIRDAHGILRRGGEMLQPWFTAQHPVKELCDVGLRYSFEFPRIGNNEVVLKTRYRENSNLEAGHLLGDFGVKLEGMIRKIVPRVGKI